MVIVTTVAIIMVPIIVMFFIVASVTQASDTFSFFCIHVTIGHVD
jgi:hypothetical protein